MVVTILGASGFVGSNLCKSLEDKYKIKNDPTSRILVCNCERLILHILTKKYNNKIV